MTEYSIERWARLMADYLQYTSIEMQELFAELLRGQTPPEEIVQKLAARHVTELELKTNKLQVDIFDIGERMRDQQARDTSRLETKIDQELHDRLGKTNEMLVDLLEELRRQAERLDESAADRRLIHDWMERIEALVNELIAYNNDLPRDERVSLVETVRAIRAAQQKAGG